MPVTEEVILEPVGPAGSLWSSANEFGRYLQMQLQDGISPDGVQVVSADNLLHTREPQVQMNANMSYGLGWMISDYHGLPLISHGGNTLGFTSELMFLPEFGYRDRGADQSPAPRTSSIRGWHSGHSSCCSINLRCFRSRSISFSTDLRKRRSKCANGLARSPSLGDVAPYLGIYRSDALGEVGLPGGQTDGFTIDAGEFVSDTETGQWRRRAWRSNFVGWDGVMAGQPLTITNRRQLATRRSNLHWDGYLSVRVRGASDLKPPTGEGSPVASPVASSMKSEDVLDQPPHTRRPAGCLW